MKTMCRTWRRIPYYAKGLIITTIILACIAGSAGDASNGLLLIVGALAVGVGSIVYNTLKND